MMRDVHITRSGCSKAPLAFFFFAFISLGLVFFSPVLRNSLAAEPPPSKHISLPYNGSFKIGEQLHYEVYWTYFKAGYAYTRVLKQKKYQGINCVVLQSGARSIGFLGKIFRVKDRITSYWDFAAKRTLYSKKDLREGNYFRHTLVHFDHKKRSAQWSLRSFAGNAKELGKKKKDAKWKSKAGTAQNLPPKIHDMLSAVYYNRSSSKQGKAGDIFHVDVFDDHKLLKLKMEILREEMLPVKINGIEKEITAFVVRPHITSTGVFRVKGKVLLWISKDRHRFPLLIKAEAPVLGHIYVKLYRTVNTTPL